MTTFGGDLLRILAHGVVSADARALMSIVNLIRGFF